MHDKVHVRTAVFIKSQKAPLKLHNNISVFLAYETIKHVLLLINNHNISSGCMFFQFLKCLQYSPKTLKNDKKSVLVVV